MSLIRQALFDFTHFLQNLPQHVPSSVLRTAQLQYISKYGNISLKLLEDLHNDSFGISMGFLGGFFEGEISHRKSNRD